MSVSQWERLDQEVVINISNFVTQATVSGEPQTFAEFVLNAATILSIFMDWDGAPLQEAYTASPYYREKHEEAVRLQAYLQSLTDEQWERRAEMQYHEGELERLQVVTESEQCRVRLQQRIAEVGAWKPPTSEHEGLKRIMLEKLEDALEIARIDGDSAPIVNRLTGAELKEIELERVERDVAKMAERYADEVAYNERRTAWVRALRASLEAADVASPS